MNRNNIKQPRPQWVDHMEWLQRQPDLLEMAREALPFVTGAMALMEETSIIDGYEDAKSTASRLKGAIAKEDAKRSGKVPFPAVPKDLNINEWLNSD